MANLGTLNQMGYGNGFGTDAADTFNKYMAQQIATKGSDTDKLLYVLGGAIGNAMRKNREARENKKIDAILEGAKNDGTEYVGNGVGTTALTPEQYQSIVQQGANTVANAPQSEGSISIGQAPQLSENDKLINNYLANQGNRSNDFVSRTTNNGMNNYNWDYVMKQARDQGISERVLNSRKEEIQRDIAQKANTTLLPQIQQKLYGYTDTDGNYHKPDMQGALTDLNELARYSPEAAKLYQGLVTNAIQGDINFARQKELKQMDNASRLAVKNAGAAPLTPGKYLQSMGFSSYADLEKAISKFKVVDESNPDKFKALTPEQDKQLGQLLEVQKRYNSLVQGIPQTPSTPTVKGPVTDGEGKKNQSPADAINDIVKATDFSNYDKDVEEGSYNFNTGTQAIVNLLRKDKKTDKEIYDFVDGILADAEKDGELPEGYRRSFAHSMGVKTQEDVINEGIEEIKNKRLGTVDKNGFRNNWSEWDIQPQIAKVRGEYFDNQEAAQKKYGFRTYYDYVNWLMNEGE